MLTVQEANALIRLARSAPQPNLDAALASQALIEKFIKFYQATLDAPKATDEKPAA